MKLDGLVKNIKGIAYDSNRVESGYCFVAIKGSHIDGHKFIDTAIKKGAAVIISDHPVVVPSGVENIVVDDTRLALAKMSSEFFGHPSGKMHVIRSEEHTS